MSLQEPMDWRSKMAYTWKKLGCVLFPDECLSCKKIIHRGETAFWLKTRGIMHPECGTGSKPIFHLLSIYTENPTYDKNPFENILEHKPEFYAAKEMRASFDN